MNEPHRQGLLRLNLSTEFQNKTCLAPAKWNKKDNEYNQKWAFGFTFYPQVITLDAWVKHVLSGKAFTMASYEGNTRRKSTFVSSQIVGLDFDGNVSVADCLADAFISTHAYLIYPTPSSTPEHPKTRVMFLLDTPVTDVQQWERLQRGLLWQYQSLNPDPSCKDGARLFYGSDKEGAVILKHILASDELGQFATAMEAEIGGYAEVRSAEDNTRIREQNRRNLADDKKKQRYYSYALKALDNMVSELSGLSEGSGNDGGRNSTLFKYAAKCGNFIAANMISYGECERALYSAATASGLPRQEIDNTLSRAIAQGTSSPTDTDALDREWERKARDWKQQRQTHAQTVTATYQEIKAALPVENNEPQVATDEDIIQFAEIVETAHLQTVAKNWLVFNDGYYMSWFQGEHVPLSFVSAMLNLAHSRSSTAWVLIAMHQCMIDGRLSWALFSVADVVNATGLNRALVKKAFIELERGGYVRFLKTDSLSNILSIIHKDLTLETVHNLNQHIADYYAPILDLSFIRKRLLAALRRHYTEKYARMGLAVPSWELAYQMGIENQEDYTAWCERFKSARAADEDIDRAARLFHQEFNGDSHNWKGWETALNSPFAIPVDWKACESIKDVRGQILKQFIQIPRRNVNSQLELSRLIGASSATLSDVMRSQNIATIEQTEKVVIEADFNNLQPIRQQMQRDKRGMIRMMWFKEHNEKGWLQQDLKKADVMYVRNRKRIAQVSIQLVTPSLQKVMTAAEIEAVYTIREKITEVKAIQAQANLSNEDKVLFRDMLKRAKKAARAARMKLIPKLIDELDVLIAAHGIADTEPIPSEHVSRESAPETKPRSATINSRDWTAYSHTMVWRDIDKQIRMYTDYQLVGNVILDSEKNVVFKAENYQLAPMFTWLRENASLIKRPLKVQEDYTPEIHARLREERESVTKALYDSLVPEFDKPANKVIPMPLPERSAPKAKPLSDERLQSFLDFCNNRQEREHGIKRPVTDWKLPAKPPVDESWTDANGFLYEVCGDDMYVDGVKQYMTDELWNFVSRKRKSA